MKLKCLLKEIFFVYARPSYKLIHKNINNYYFLKKKITHVTLTNLIALV